MQNKNENIKSNNSMYYLLTWFSPSFPIGAYAYSHGLEYAIESKTINNISDLENWLSDFLNYGTCYNDGILISSAYDAVINNNIKELEKIALIAKAFKPTKEISLESNQQGISFAQTLSASLKSKKFDSLINSINKNISYVTVVACAGAVCSINKIDLLNSYFHAFISNLVSAALRLMSIGQTDSQILILKFKKEVELLTNKILLYTIDDMGSSVFIGDWSSAKHEKQYSRLFRS
ncbi:MAG: urease accessory UreF family protein [Alphaproteobacteria bacterium]